MTLAEKAAYLKGLMDGIKLDTEKDENRLLKAVVDLLQDMAISIDDLEDNAIAVSDELDEIEENLDAIDEYLMDEDDEDFDDYEDYDDDLDYDLGDDDFDYDEDPVYEVTCPKCGEVHQFSEKELLEGSKPCSKCGELLEFEFDEDDGEEMPF
ncbi:MAG: hypothetical protein IKQ54_03445 [Oscillospiraceae bacterium]|nr:hypothetical protein [Oscillospiraceae bacterium]MBR4193369.1 hypothetical protein [Oscillospiraceae bacterium]